MNLCWPVKWQLKGKLVQEFELDTPRISCRKWMKYTHIPNIIYHRQRITITVHLVWIYRKPRPILQCGRAVMYNLCNNDVCVTGNFKLQDFLFQLEINQQIKKNDQWCPTISCYQLCGQIIIDHNQRVGSGKCFHDENPLDFAVFVALSMQITAIMIIFHLRSHTLFSY